MRLADPGPHAAVFFSAQPVCARAAETLPRAHAQRRPLPASREPRGPRGEACAALRPLDQPPGLYFKSIEKPNEINPCYQHHEKRTSKPWNLEIKLMDDVSKEEVEEHKENGSKVLLLSSILSPLRQNQGSQV
ncbi:uncharacterized protein AAEQ78_010847 [Lycaon pictus]